MSVAVVAVFLLTLFSNRGINQKNSFVRKFFKQSIVQVHATAINDSVRSICGTDGSHIYFDTPIATKVFEVDSNLANGDFIDLPLANSDTVNSLFTIRVNSSIFYILAGNVPAIITIKPGAQRVDAHALGKIFFTRAVIVNRNTVVLRGYKTVKEKLEQIFYKVNTNNNVIVQEQNISAKTHDAGFSTDGLLHYDAVRHYLVFVNYYSNNFMCLDTNLRLLYKSRTIDTVSTYQTTANTVGSRNNTAITNTSPIRDINLYSSVSNGRIFINSALAADNEKRKDFLRNSVIDVYNTQNGIYRGSLYIPLFKGERLKEFFVIDRRIIVLYHGYAVIYTLPFAL